MQINNRHAVIYYNAMVVLADRAARCLVWFVEHPGQRIHGSDLYETLRQARDLSDLLCGDGDADNNTTDSDDQPRAATYQDIPLADGHYDGYHIVRHRWDDGPDPDARRAYAHELHRFRQLEGVRPLTADEAKQRVLLERELHPRRTRPAARGRTEAARQIVSRMLAEIEAW